MWKNRHYLLQCTHTHTCWFPRLETALLVDGWGLINSSSKRSNASSDISITSTVSSIFYFKIYKILDTIKIIKKKKWKKWFKILIIYPTSSNAISTSGSSTSTSCSSIGTIISPSLFSFWNFFFAIIIVLKGKITIKIIQYQASPNLSENRCRCLSQIRYHLPYLRWGNPPWLGWYRPIDVKKKITHCFF